MLGAVSTLGRLLRAREEPTWWESELWVLEIEVYDFG